MLLVLLLASSLLIAPASSELFEYCYRFVKIPPMPFGNGHSYKCALKSDWKNKGDGLVSYGLHIGREDVLNCNDASADIAGGWRTPCLQTTLDIPIGLGIGGANVSDFKECTFPPGLPNDYDGSNHTFSCFLEHLTNRFCGIIDNHMPTCAWKEAVLSVQISHADCTWLQMSPGPCGGTVHPPDVSPAKVTDDFLNQQNAAINNLAFCPLAEVANASSSDGAGEVTVRFYRLGPPRGEIVESIVLDGHRVGYGAIPGYYGLYDGGRYGGAVPGYWGGEIIMAQRWGEEVCIAYEYMDRTGITEPYYGTCRETCVQIDGENEYISRRSGEDMYSKVVVSLKVEATSQAIPSGAEDAGSDGSSGRIPSLSPLLLVAFIFNIIFIFSIS